MIKDMLMLNWKMSTATKTPTVSPCVTIMLVDDKIFFEVIAFAHVKHAVQQMKNPNVNSIMQCHSIIFIEMNFRVTQARKKKSL